MLETSPFRYVSCRRNAIVSFFRQRRGSFIQGQIRHEHTTSQILAIDRWKHPTRGGQNLSERYRRLEKSLRGKESRTKHIDVLPSSSHILSSPLAQAREILKTFRGLAIPQEPKAPEPDECCMSGCTICVHDLYQDDLSTYNDSLSALRASLNALEIPESEWPESIRVKPGERGKKKDVSLTAFEEMERTLRERHAKEVAVDSNEQRRLEKEKSMNADKVMAVYEGLRWILFGNR